MSMTLGAKKEAVYRADISLLLLRVDTHTQVSFSLSAVFTKYNTITTNPRLYSIQKFGEEAERHQHLYDWSSKHMTCCTGSDTASGKYTTPANSIGKLKRLDADS